MPPSSNELRLDDYLIMTQTEKALESSVEGAANGITYYTIAMVVTGIVFNKSLVQLWNMLNLI